MARELFSLFVPNREASTSRPISKEGSGEVALSISRFIDACKADQIRLAPDKCTDHHPSE